MRNHYSFFSPTRRSRLPLGGLLLLASLIIGMPAAAQNFATIGNQFVSASICSDKASGSLGGGRFNISAGPDNGNYRLLYATTSNVVFRIAHDSTVNFYTSTGTGGSGGRPYVGGSPAGNATPVTYLPYTSFDVSQDSVVTTWKAEGFTIKQRLFIEKPQTPYDNGADVVIEYEWSADPSTPQAELGIFLMLDLYNGQAAGSGGSADYTSVATSQGYFPIEHGGKLFTPPLDTIPDWYHTGNFLYQGPVNIIMPIHRLRGTTHRGLPVTTPDIFAVGDWINYLRYYSWDISASDVSKPFHDAATAMRWGGLKGSGKIRTAYGMDDRTGNNIYHCRDTAVFIDIKTVRVAEQKTLNGLYTPAKFNVDMWITNTNPTGLTDMTVTMTQPIGGTAGKNRLTLDPSTPNPAVNASLPASATRHFQWVLDVAPETNDSLLNIPLEFKYQYSIAKQPRVFKVPCTPVITLKGYIDSVALRQDHSAPIIVKQSAGMTTSVAIRDTHPNFHYDSGLDTVEIRNISNFQMTPAAPAFAHCDTNASIQLAFAVIDSTKPARVDFCTSDCKGNVSCDSVVYTPKEIEKPKDAIGPVIGHVTQTTTRLLITVRDRHGNQNYDTGLRSIQIVNNDNFVVQQTPTTFTQCDTTVDVNLLFTVVDSTKPARVDFCTSDCYGNSVCDSVLYRPAIAAVPADEATAGMAFTRSYPNPVSSILTVEYRLPVSGAVALRLYNAIGREVLSIDGSGHAGSQAREIDLRSLPAGAYRLTLTQNGITVSQPVTVVR